MGKLVNVNGAWKKVKKLSVNINGVWKEAVEYVNVNGVWKKIFEPYRQLAKWSGNVNDFYKVSDGSKSFSVRFSVTSIFLTITDLITGITTDKKIGDRDDNNGSGLVEMTAYAVANNYIYFTSRIMWTSNDIYYLFTYDTNLNEVRRVRYYHNNAEYISSMTGRGDTLYATKGGSTGGLVILNPANLAVIKSTPISITHSGKTSFYYIPDGSPEHGMNTVLIMSMDLQKTLHYRQYDLNLNLIREKQINFSAYIPSFTIDVAVNYYNDYYMFAQASTRVASYNIIFDLVNGSVVSAHSAPWASLRGSAYYYDGDYTWFGLTINGGPNSFVRKAPGLTANFNAAGYVEYPLLANEYVEKIRSAPGEGVVATCPKSSVFYRFI